MFGKLLKYEMKSTSRVYGVLFAALLITSILPGIGQMINIEFLSNFFQVIFAMGIVPAVTVYIVVIIKRYSDSLYGNEGYLTFTLPVKSWQLILCKLLSATIWALATGFVMVLCFSIFLVMISVSEGLPLFLILKQMGLGISQLFEYKGEAIIIYFFILFLFLGINFVMKLYFCISLGNIPIFNKHSTIFAIISYFVLSAIETRLGFTFSNTINWSFETNNSMNFYDVFFTGHMLQFLLSTVAFSAVFIVLYFALTTYITSKKVLLK